MTITLFSSLRNGLPNLPYNTHYIHHAPYPHFLHNPITRAQLVHSPVSEQSAKEASCTHGPQSYASETDHPPVRRQSVSTSTDFNDSLPILIYTRRGTRARATSGLVPPHTDTLCAQMFRYGCAQDTRARGHLFSFRPAKIIVI